MTRRIDTALERAGLPPLERYAWVEVDIDRLTSNSAALRSKVEPSALAAVVKADGYGHGLEMAGRCAVAGGARWLCVADASEAVRLRRDGYAGRVFVLYPVPLAHASSMAQLEVDVTVGDIKGARALADSSSSGLELAVHVEIDTGMTRGGVHPDDAVSAAAIVAGGRSTRLEGVWSHLAAPEDSARTENQIAIFGSVLDMFSAAGLEPESTHVAASGGMLAIDTAGYSMVRPGLAFYGLHPGAGADLPDPVAPALSVRAHPVRVAEVPGGTEVGYAGTWVAQRTSLIATLPLGYADGWSRSSSPGSTVLVQGRRAPVVGRVSSDSLTVDVTEIEGVGLDSEFTLLGGDGSHEISADDVAVVRKTISWEVLQQLGSRLSRVYTSGRSTVAVRGESTVELIAAAGVPLPGY